MTTAIVLWSSTTGDVVLRSADNSEVAAVQSTTIYLNPLPAGTAAVPLDIVLVSATSTNLVLKPASTVWAGATSNGNVILYQILGPTTSGSSGTASYSLSGGARAYAYSGVNAGFSVGRNLAGVAGAYSFTGQDGVLSYTHGASAVAYSLSGDAGAYSVQGQDATLLFSGVDLPKQGGLHKLNLKASFKGVETEEQKRLRREAQGIIARIQKAEPQDAQELQAEAEDISAQLQEAIGRLELAAEAYGQALKVKQAQKAQKQAKELQNMLVQAQVQAELMQQQIEELDVAFVVMMVAAHI